VAVGDPVTTADAVQREADWLNATDDVLPKLLASAGGPFDVVQAYRPRTPRQRARSLYVIRRGFREDRFANVRRMAHYNLELQINWPIQNSQGSGEDEQTALDAAVELVLQRVGGLPFDKTHGGRFRSVAEEPKFVDVAFSDPEEAFAKRPGVFEAAISYWADDFEITG
jgi:hypothetical protein